jgi:PEP-CTERM motif
MKTTYFAAALAACSAVAMAAPAFAAPTLGATACSFTDISPAASACEGWYTGNLVAGSPASKADQAAALNALLGVSSYSGGTLTWLETLPSLGGAATANFTTALYGKTIVAFHAGAAVGEPTGVGYNGTAFYLFDAGNLVGGLDLIGFNRAGLSNARLYSTGKFVKTAVPEPATWGMMIAGFGLVGASLRRRKAVRAFA